MGGLTLPALMTELKAAEKAKDRNVILIWLEGGQSHSDFCDPKPQTPSYSLEEYSSPEWTAVVDAVKDMCSHAREHREKCWGYKREVVLQTLAKLEPLLKRIQQLSELDNARTQMATMIERDRNEVFLEFQEAALLFVKSGALDGKEQNGEDDIARNSAI